MFVSFMLQAVSKCSFNIPLFLLCLGACVENLGTLWQLTSKVILMESGISDLPISRELCLNYLCKEILFLMVFVCLFVCLSTTLRKKLMDFDEIFWKCWGWYKEQSSRFWKLLVERRPQPTFRGKITLLVF